MSRLLSAAANGLWWLSALPEGRAFRRAARDVAGTQERLLLALLRRNATTDFGRRHGFAAIRSVAEFRQRVPLSTYDDYLELIRRVGEGEAGVLTAEPVRLLELTSGSAAASKQIPYTAGLQAELQRAIAPWIADLFRHDPRLLAGQAYWSISPVARRNQRTPAGIPIGFEDDAEYLDPVRRRLVQAVMAVPPQVRLITDMAAFRYATLYFLLRSRSLRLISAWNPTFITLLMQPLPAWAEQLADDIARGALTAPDMDPDVRTALLRRCRPDPARAAEIRAAVRAGGSPGEVHRRLWPGLRLVSCWTEAQAGPYVPAVEQLFPQARIQGKGLIATEGFVSFPLHGQPGAALAIRSHFFEFLPAGGGAPLLAHQLEPGGLYSVVLTTGGGLYRYQLHDLVQVTGRLDQCPLLRFVGKEAHISDRFGEKVNERHVRAALERLFDRHGLAPAFAMVACVPAADGGYAYTLFVEAPDCADERLRQAAAGLEGALQENFHYRYCRELGQLGPARAFRISGSGAAAYLRTCQQLGQRAGDVKPTALHRWDGWLDAFDGRLL